jgi:transposase
MTNVTLTDTEWTRIRAFLKDDPNAYIGTDEAACRRFVEAVKWMSRSGAAWRLLPESYGQWNSTYKRFKRWCAAGV